jgi:RNA polymerase sigma-70 factor (ECF subfamily)
MGDREGAWTAPGGDRAAAERLVEDSYSQVFAGLCRLTGGDEDLAADLTQETYRKAWQALSGFDGRSAFTTWLYRISYNTFLNHLRRPRPLHPLDEAHLDALADDEPSPRQRASASEEAARLRRAVLTLPDELRFTVSARFWGELSVREIARLEGITGVAIRKRLKKAFALLRRTLEEEVVA